MEGGLIYRDELSNCGIHANPKPLFFEPLLQAAVRGNRNAGKMILIAFLFAVFGLAVLLCPESRYSGWGDKHDAVHEPATMAGQRMPAAVQQFQRPERAWQVKRSANLRQRVQAARAHYSAGVPASIGTYAQLPDEITNENPLRVIIAGAGIGGLVLANSLAKHSKMQVIVLEKTKKFQRFGGPIQLASNALQVLKELDEALFKKIMEKFTVTGDKMNGIKDGIRAQWWVMFDLASPAEARNMPYTGVIERPDLQEIFLNALPPGVVRNGDAVARYETNSEGHGVKAIMESGDVLEGDVIVGADGIWSKVRATLWNAPVRGEGSGVTYSGYTVFAGDLVYKSFDNGEVGYKVYIGPRQYFVITDVGNGRYQWYAFLSRDPGTAKAELRPDGQVHFLKTIFEGWSEEIHHILDATHENEIQQRDLYEIQPFMRKPWARGPVALLGDSVHAMMPNLGQGGCQAIEDAFVITQELESLKTRSEISSKLQRYHSRRLIRCAAVQGLSKIVSDVIPYLGELQFGQPAKISMEGGLKPNFSSFERIMTEFTRPVIPIGLRIQFAFLYGCWRNEAAIDLKPAAGFLLALGSFFLARGGFAQEASVGLELSLKSIFGSEGGETLLANIRHSV